MKRTVGVLGVTLLTLSLVACADTHKKKVEPAAQAPALVESATVKVTATVTAINLEKREVTLRTEDGKTETVHVDEAVRNLPQVKVGDKVVAEYHESVEVQVKKPGAASPGVVVAENVDRAKPGETPAGVGARTITVTATIEAIDRKTSHVTLKGPAGNLQEVQVRNPAHLDNVQVGDLVEFTYTEALAIRVEKPTKQ